MLKKDQELLQELRNLHEKYQSTIEGRKDIINEIREKIGEIRKQTTCCSKEIDEIERYYNYRDYYLSDYRLAMSLLLRLANLEDDAYRMREVTVTDFYNTGGKEVNRLYSKVLFITEKNIVDYFSELNHSDEFAKKAAKYINMGLSMIIITSNLFESDVKPKKYDLKCDKCFDIRNVGIIGNITCYISDPVLQKNIDKFMDYININGSDFSGIDEDTLFTLINKSNGNQKKI